MPSRKVEAAVLGRSPTVAKQPAGRSAVRVSVAPKDVAQALEQADRRASGQAGGGVNRFTPFQHGILVTLEFVAGTLTRVVEHKLGGEAQGFIVVDMVTDQPPTTISRDEIATNPDLLHPRQDSHIKLNASNPCKAKVWIWR